MSRPSTNFFKLDMLLLKLLEVQDCYGYQIVQLLSELSNKTITIKEGTMYPILYRLMENGYISDRKVLVGKRQTRIYYHIEPAGKEYLKELYEEYNCIKSNIDYIMSWEGEVYESEK